MIDYQNLAETLVKNCKYNLVAIIENAMEATDENILARAEEIIKTAAKALYSHRKGADNNYTYSIFEKEAEAKMWDWLIVAMAENAVHRLGTEQQTNHNESNVQRVFSNPRSYYVSEMNDIMRRVGVV